MALPEMPDDEFFGDVHNLPNGSGSGTFALDDGSTATYLLNGPAIAEALPPIEYLVSELGLVSGPGAPHLIAGYGFSGKTLACQSMLLSLAAAEPVWGSYIIRDPHSVIHIDLEQGERLTRRRYQRLALAMDIDLVALGDRIQLAALPPLRFDPSWEDEWLRLFTGRQIALIDSLRAASAGLDENDSKIREGLDMLTRVSEKTGCRALVIHHARKPKMGEETGAMYAIRGSSAIFDAVDAAYVFAAEKDKPIDCTQVKARSHGEPVPAVCLQIIDVPNGQDMRAGVKVTVHGEELGREQREAAQATANLKKLRADAEAMLAIVRAEPGVGKTELRDRTGFNGPRFRLAFADIQWQIRLEREKVDRVWKERIYLKHPTGTT